MNDNEESVPRDEELKTLALKAKRPGENRGALFYGKEYTKAIICLSRKKLVKMRICVSAGEPRS